jgi:hypothetical protein
MHPRDRSNLIAVRRLVPVESIVGKFHIYLFVPHTYGEKFRGFGRNQARIFLWRQL